MKRKDILEMLNQNTEYISRINYFWSRMPIMETGFPDRESEVYKLVKELEEEYHNWKEQEIKSEN
jgi:hypothetical protein